MKKESVLDKPAFLFVALSMAVFIGIFWMAGPIKWEEKKSKNGSDKPAACDHAPHYGKCQKDDVTYIVVGKGVFPIFHRCECVSDHGIGKK